MSRTIKAVEPHMIPQAKVPPVRLAALIDSGNVKVVLDRILPLSEARRAHKSKRPRAWKDRSAG